VSPFPGKQSRDQFLGLGGPGACDSCPVVVDEEREEDPGDMGHRHVLFFLVLCFTIFTSMLFKVTVSEKNC